MSVRRLYRAWAGAVSEGLAKAVVVAVLEEFANITCVLYLIDDGVHHDLLIRKDNTTGHTGTVNDPPIVVESAMPPGRSI